MGDLTQGVQAAHPIDTDRAEKKMTALNLRSQRLSYREIGRRLHISYQSAYNYVAEALADLRAASAEKAQEILELELHELDRRQALYAEDASYEATRAVLKIQERRAKLLGLDAPTSFRLMVPTNDGQGPGFAAGLNLKAMSTDELRALEALYQKYGTHDDAPAASSNGNGNSAGPITAIARILSPGESIPPTNGEG